jgi:hypothetical protein
MDFFGILTAYLVPIVTVGGLVETAKRLFFNRIKNIAVRKWIITASPFLIALGVSVGWSFPGGVWSLSFYIQNVLVNWAFSSLIWTFVKRFLDEKK